MAKAAAKSTVVKPVKKKTPPRSAQTPKTSKSADTTSHVEQISNQICDKGVKPRARKAPAPKKAAAPTRVVEAEIVDVEDDAAPVFEGDLENELPPLDAAIDFDPDREIVEEEIRSVAAKGKKTRRVKAEIVEDGDEDEGRLHPADGGPERSESKAVATTADPISVYLSEIRRYPLLTKEQEQELAIRYRETGDAKAAELLVTSNLRFVVKIAAEYSRFGAKLIDLVQEGNVGLMHGVREFNPYRGVRLITYAVWWIRGYIQEYLMRQYSLVRIGTTQNQRKLFYRLQKERDALGSLGVTSTNALLAGRLGVSEEEVETMSKRLSGRDVSLSQPVDSSGQSSASLLDFEPSADVGVDDQIGHLEEMEVLKDNLAKLRPLLNEKETYILENRILADEPMTLQEIGEHYGVTREAVRQLEARLINRIRTAVTHQLDGDDD